MIKLQKPTAPEDFATDPAVEAAKQRMELQIVAAEKLLKAKQAGEKTKRKEDGFPKGEDFPPEWGRYKEIFASAQHEKCAYCEGLPLITGDGTIDHFRPKVEVKGKGNKKTIHRPGYWWLAYDWNNWLFSCLKCNRRKGNQFPLFDASAQLQRGCEQAEAAVLLQPYINRPEDHFEFDEAGKIFGRTRNGSISVEVLELNRAPLKLDRENVARDLLRHLDDYENQPSEKSFERITEFMKDNAKYAGMCRYLIFLIAGALTRWTLPKQMPKLPGTLA